MNTEDSHAYRSRQSDARPAWNAETLAVAAFLAGIVASRSRLARWALLTATGGWLWSKMRHAKPVEAASLTTEEPSSIESYIDDAWARHEAEQVTQAPQPEDEPSEILSVITAAVSHETPLEIQTPVAAQPDEVQGAQPEIPLNIGAPVALASLFSLVTPDNESSASAGVDAVADDELSPAEVISSTPVEASAPVDQPGIEEVPVVVSETPATTASELAEPEIEVIEPVASTVEDEPAILQVVETPVIAEALLPDDTLTTPPDVVEEVAAELPVASPVEAETTSEPVTAIAAPEPLSLATPEPLAEAELPVSPSEPQPLFGAPENLTIASMLGGDQRVFELPSAPAVSAATISDLDRAFAKVGRDTPASPFVMPVATAPSPFAMPETQAPTLAEQIAADMSAALLSVPASKDDVEPADQELPVAEAVAPSTEVVADDADEDEPLGKSAAWLLGIEPTTTVEAVDHAMPVVKHDSRPITAPIAEGRALPDVIEIPESKPNVPLHPEIEAIASKDTPLRPITKGLLNKVLETTSQRPATAPLPVMPAVEPAPPAPVAVEPPMTFRLPPARPPQRPQSWIAAELAREAEEKAGGQGKASPDADSPKPVAPQAPAVAASSDKKAWIDWWK